MPQPASPATLPTAARHARHRSSGSTASWPTDWLTDWTTDRSSAHADWTELWQACVAVLDRHPHIHPAPAPWAPVLRRVRIPVEAVAAADVHYHLE